MVLLDFFTGILHGNNSVFAMLQRTVHATGTECFPTDSTVNGIDYIMLQTSLQFIILHQRFP